MSSSQEFKLELELYRFLRVGEIMDRFDECMNDTGDKWEFIPNYDHGRPRPAIYKPMRRRLSPLPWGPEVVAKETTDLSDAEISKLIDIAKSEDEKSIREFWDNFLDTRGIKKRA